MQKVTRYPYCVERRTVHAHERTHRRDRPRSILCDPYAVAMRTGAPLPSADFPLLCQSGSTSRTLSTERLLWGEFFCHSNFHVQTGRELD